MTSSAIFSPVKLADLTGENPSQVKTVHDIPLVCRGCGGRARLLKRGNFTSTEDLQQQILDFIDYFNLRCAKPFHWKFEGFQ